MADYQGFSSVIRSISAYLLIFVLWPLLPFVYSIFFIYRRIVSEILRLKYGEKYGGLFDKADSMWLIKDKSNCRIVIVLISKFDEEKDMYKFMEDQTRTKVFADPRAYPKLTSTHRMFSGYPFWVRNDYRLHECLKTLPISVDREFDEDYLKEITSNLYDVPLPRNGLALWDIYISPKYLMNYKNDGSYYYPILLRLNHAIGDGTSIFELIIQWLASNNTNNYSTKIFKTRSKGSKKKPKRRILLDRLLLGLKKMVNLTALIFYVAFIGPVNALKATHLKPTEQNALHGPELTGKKIIAWRTEKNPEYIAMVKRIRRRMPGTKFSNILITAVSASFTDYFKKSSQPVPDIFSSIMTELPHLPEIDRSKPIPLDNKTSYVFYEFPTNKNSLLKTLEQVKLYGEKIKYGDKLILRLADTVAGMTPVPLYKFFLGPLANTNILSNVPGCENICLNNGGVLDSFIAFAPNMKVTGVTLSIISYDDKFQIGIIVDKAITSSREEVQNLVDNIFNYIKCLDIESRIKYGD